MERARGLIGRHFLATAVLCSLLAAGSAQAGPAPATLMPALQSVGNAYNQGAGPDFLVVIEAENHFRKLAGTNNPSDSWTLDTTRGATAMLAGPDVPGGGQTINFPGFAPNVAPRMDYLVNFTQTGTHWIWARGYGPDTSGDSIHFGLDGVALASADEMGDFYPVQPVQPPPPAPPLPPVLPRYQWIETRNGNNTPFINFQVANAGVHIVNLWMRQDGVSVDKFLITTNTNYAAFDADQTINLPPGVTISSQSPTSPPTPTNLRGTPGPGQAVLTWDAAPYATTYDLYRSQSVVPPISTTVPTVSGITTTTYTNTGLTDGQQYHYWVRALNSVGTSLWISPQTTVAPPGPPPVPTGLTPTPGTGQVTLTWNLSPGATSYTVGISPTSGGPYTPTSGITAPPNTQSGVNGTPYFFVVSATNVYGQTSAWSAEVTATPGGAPSQPPPTMLFAQGGNLQVQLDWNPASGATSYNVLRSTSPGGIPTAYVSIATGVMGITYTDTTVTNGTTYYYVVRAVGPPGTSINSNEASATPFGAPLAPTNLTATAGNNQVFLNWTGSAGAGGYTVFQSTAAPGPPWTQVATNITTNSYTVSSGVTNGTQYFFVVQAFNVAGPSLDSNVASATPTTTPVPVPPTGLTAVAGDAQVALSWNAVSGATGYNILQSTTQGSGYVQVFTSTGPSFNVTSGVTNGTPYYFVVQATNANGASGNSNEATATPSATPPPPPPPPPTGLVATAGNTVVGLSWNASTGATSYNVLMATVGGGPYTLVTGNVLGTTYTVTGLANNIQYFFVVQAVNGAPQPSGNSNEASATPTGTPPTPTAPTITSTSPLPGGTVGTFYSFAFQATGSTPITWTNPGGGLPAGLSLTGAVLSGTPTAAAPSTFTIQAANGTLPNASMSFMLTIAPMPATPPTITSTSPLPAGTVGTAYSFTFQATGSTPITWTVVAGALPGGLALSGAGVLSGIPTAAGPFNFTVQAANGTAPNAQMAFSITINPAAAGSPVITSTSPLPAATVGTPYSFTFTATGTAPITWAAVGPLPGGLTLSAAGVLSGTPTTAGAPTLTVQATNGAGTTAGTFAITINAAPPPPPPPVPGAGSDGDEGGCGTSVPPPAMPWMWLLAGLSLLALGLGKGH